MKATPHPAQCRRQARSPRREASEAADVGMVRSAVDADQTADDGETPSDEEWG